MKVTVVGLKKSYGATRAVDDVSFEFASGQVIGFVGPNGAGKTTTLRILATLEEPTAGDALVDGVSLIEEPEKARRLVGFVPDHLPTHRDMTVHEYLDFFARAYGLRGGHRRQVVARVEEFTGLTGVGEKYLIALSLGMKQRVSVARALLHDPPVLLMDEPASGLDPRARVELRELLKLLSWQGKAILISSHILTELAEVCTGVVILDHGKVLCAGTLPEILAAGAPRRTVHVRLLERHDEACELLPGLPHVARAGLLMDNTVEVEVDGPDSACCELLAALVREGYPVIEFRPRRAGLEEVFMSVTQGKVQ